jgi:hypothetical protein
LLKPGALQVHLIDYSDHFARGDDGLSRFNFLTYSDDEWRPFNSSFQYVNRLRHSEFLSLFREAGLTAIRIEADSVKPQQPVLDRLASQFRTFEVDDLFTTRAMVVLAPQL